MAVHPTPANPTPVNPSLNPFTPPAPADDSPANGRQAAPRATLRPMPGWLDPQVLRDAGVRVGERVRVADDVLIDRPDMLELDDDVQIGPGVRLVCEGGLTIRARTIVSAGAQLLSAAPSIPRRGRRVSEAAPDRGQIEIHTDVWIGHNAVVMPGTIIHPDAVVQPGCVVKKLVPARIVIGNLTHHQHNRDLV